MLDREPRGPHQRGHLTHAVPAVMADCRIHRAPEELECRHRDCHHAAGRNRGGQPLNQLGVVVDVLEDVEGHRGVVARREHLQWPDYARPHAARAGQVHCRPRDVH